jgi:hypothetical protein
MGRVPVGSFLGSSAVLVAWVALTGCDQPAPACPGIPEWPGQPPLQDLQGLHSFNDQPWNAMGTWRVPDRNWYYARRTSSKDDEICAESATQGTGAKALRIVFTQDMAPNSEPSVHWIMLPEVRSVYAAWWVKLSANWSPSPAGGGKVTFLHTPTGQVYTGFFGSSAPHHLSVNTEWAPYGQKIWDPNVATTPLQYNQWYRIEWYLQWASAPQVADGIMRWWVNGVLNGNYTNVSYPNDAGFTQFEFAPTLQNPPPAEQYMYIGHTYIRTP